MAIEIDRIEHLGTATFQAGCCRCKRSVTGTGGLSSRARGAGPGGDRGARIQRLWHQL